MTERGTPPVGSWARKLDAAQVREIKAALSDGLCVSELAARYGVSSSTIRSIKAGETWGHVKP